MQDSQKVLIGVPKEKVMAGFLTLHIFVIGSLRTAFKVVSGIDCHTFLFMQYMVFIFF